MAVPRNEEDFMLEIDRPTVLQMEPCPFKSRVISLARAFFLQSEHEKTVHEGALTGYGRLGESYQAGATEPDIVESFVVEFPIRSAGHPMKDVFDSCTAKWEHNLRQVHRQVRQTLGPATRIPASFTTLTHVNYYPGMSRVPGSPEAGSLIGPIRMGEHSDPGFFSLFPFGTSQGFEYKDRNRNWTPFWTERPFLLLGRGIVNCQEPNLKPLVHRVTLDAWDRDRLTILFTVFPTAS